MIKGYLQRALLGVRMEMGIPGWVGQRQLDIAWWAEINFKKYSYTFPILASCQSALLSCMYVCQWRSKTPGFLELKLWTVINCHVGTGNWIPRSPARASIFLHFLPHIHSPWVHSHENKPQEHHPFKFSEAQNTIIKSLPAPAVLELPL